MAMVGRALVGFAWLVLGLAAPIAARAQAVKAGVVTTAEGHVTVRRVVLPQPVPLRFKDDVFLQDTVTTGDRSLARLLLGGKALVTIRERSALTVTELPGRSTVDMDAGKVGMAVARDRMRPGEAIDIRTPNAIVAVRGTVLVVEVRRATAPAGGGSGAPTTDVYLLRDTADVTPIDPQTRTPVGPPVRVLAMQRFTVVGTAPGQVTTFTAADVPKIAEGLQPSGVPHPQAANLEEVKSLLLGTTATLLAALTGTGPERLALAPETPTPSAPPEPAPANPTAPPVIPELQPALEESARPGPLPPPPPPSGSEISLTGDVTIPAGQTLRSFSGEFTRTDPAPLIQATAASVTQLGADDLIDVLAGAQVTLASPLFDVRNSEIRAGRSLLRVDGSLFGTSPSGLVTVDPSTLASSGDLIRVDPGGGIFTTGPLLSAVDTTITTAPGHLLHVLGGDPELTTPGIVVTTGTLLSFTRSNLDLTNNLVRLVDGGILLNLSEETASPTAPPLVVFTDSTYRGGLGPNTVTGGSLLRMFSQQGRAGSGLALNGPYLSAVGSTFESREAPLFNIADGSVIISQSTQPFASFERSTVSSASSFFSLDTNTQFGPPPGAPPGTLPTVGSGEPAVVLLSSSLLRATDTNFTVNGSFLGLHNEVVLVQTGPSALVALEGSVPGGVRVTASDNFLNLSARSGRLAPELTLGGLFEGEEFPSVGGTLLSARNAVFTTGDPTANVVSLAFIADGARLVTRGPDPLFVFDSTTLDTAGNVLTLRRSRPGAPSTIELLGPLMTASRSSFDTTSRGRGSACCSGFFVGEGAQLVSSTLEPLITLDASTFNAGPDRQSGGDFFSLSTSGGNVDSTPAPGWMGLAGGLLLARDSVVSSLFSTLRVVGSTLTGSGREPLIQAVNTRITAGGVNALTGMPTLGWVVALFGGAVHPARIELWGPALSISVAPDRRLEHDVCVNTTAGLMGVFPGAGPETQTLAELVSYSDEEAPAPLATISGGSHVLGSRERTSILDFQGRASAPLGSERVEGTTVYWRTDQPIQTSRTLLLSDGATISGQKLARFDRMLFEATAPIFEGRGGSRTTLNGPNAIELSFQAKVASLGPVMRLDASRFNLLSGDLIFLNGSFLSVAGDLLWLGNGSQLNLANGAVLSVTGNSVASIGGALVNFGGIRNQINVTNTACAGAECVSFGPVRVALTGGATGANVSIGGNVVKGTGGAINYSSPNAAAIILNGSGSRVVIRGQ
jgi:hypothetical protein